MSNKPSNTPQDYQGPKDLGGSCMALIVIVAVIWFFGFRGHSPDLPNDISNTIPVTSTELPLQSGYISHDNAFAFSFPSDWQGTQDGDNVQFYLLEGAMVYVYVDDQITDFESFKSNAGENSEISNEVNTEIGGVSAQCVELSQPESKIVSAIACFTPKNGKGYVISAAELDGLSEPDRKIVQREFMDLLLSFRFLE